MNEAKLVLGRKIEKAIEELDENYLHLSEFEVVALESKIDALYEAYYSVFGETYYSQDEIAMHEAEMNEAIDYAYSDIVTMADLA